MRGLIWPRRRTALFGIFTGLICLQLFYFDRRRYYQHLGSDYAFLEATEARNLTVNLVVASLRHDDISWTSKLRIPNLSVVRYISDYDERSPPEYHPPMPRKGREATIYHTYFHDFYDRLPDVSIMVHAHENPWHIEGVLQQSMLFTLSRLHLSHVVRRGYANLRVTWPNACPDWINTTKTAAESTKQEEPLMRAAWAANFGPGVDGEAPEILAGPCCSQFAVSRDAVRRHPREQYARSRDWLLATDWSDYTAGRTWEHMFPWLFTGVATDCPIEWKAYCAMYRICFERPDMSLRYNEVWKEKEDIRELTWPSNAFRHPLVAFKAGKRVREMDKILAADLAVALERGKDDKIWRDAGGDMFNN